MGNTWELKELEQVALLEGVDIESIQHLLAPCSVKHLKPGEVLIESGKPNRLMYALLSGRLRIHLDLEAEPITVLEPGEIVGELSVLDGQPTSAHVVADGEMGVVQGRSQLVGQIEPARARHPLIDLLEQNDIGIVMLQDRCDAIRAEASVDADRAVDVVAEDTDSHRAPPLGGGRSGPRTARAL